MSVNRVEIVKETYAKRLAQIVSRQIMTHYLNLTWAHPKKFYYCIHPSENVLCGWKSTDNSEALSRDGLQRQEILEENQDSCFGYVAQNTISSRFLRRNDKYPIKFPISLFSCTFITATRKQIIKKKK